MLTSRPAGRFTRRQFFGSSSVVALSALSLAIVGCASVRVRKVPTPTQYVHWTDDMQKKADRMEGIRFYLPRPFVNVFESFPVRTDIYLASGMVSPDGQHVIITSVSGESNLARYIASPGGTASIPISQVSDPSHVLAAAAKAQAEGDNVRKDGNPTVTTVPIGVSGPVKASPSTPDPAPVAPLASTGRNTRAVKNDNGAFAYQPLRGNFDLVYMPDFEEQYAVSSRAGLGDAKFELNLGQGWSLQGFNSISDNSELNKRVFDLIDTSVRLAKTAAQTALGAPAPALQAISGTAIAQAEREVPKEARAGTPVSLKIVVIHYAAKGLYPVIKPRELAERVMKKDEVHAVIDIFKLFPSVEYASQYDPSAISRAMKSVEDPTGSFTVPRYPYQFISFNTFRYMAIEVVKPGDPFRELYDKTGTKGDSGDRQSADLGARVGRSGSTENQPEPEKFDDKTLTEWNANLKKQPITFPAGEKTNFFTVGSIARSKQAGVDFDVTITVSGFPFPDFDPSNNSGVEGAAIDLLLKALPAGKGQPDKNATYNWIANPLIPAKEVTDWNDAISTASKVIPPTALQVATGGVAANNYEITRVVVGASKVKIFYKVNGTPAALDATLQGQLITAALAQNPSATKAAKPGSAPATYEFEKSP